MVSAPEAERTTEEVPPPSSRLPRLGPGWIPCALVLVVTGIALHVYGVSTRQIVAFTAYSVFALTLPGTLLWRAMVRRSGHVGIDAAAGTAVGYAVEIPIYLLARALDAPLAVLAWPAITIVLFAAVPALRRHWRGSGERMPAWVSWVSAALMVYLLAYSALMIWRTETLTGPLANAPYVDEPFQTALIGELKHHFPANMPYVTGTPLQYHWYLHAHGAAASWITGIEPQVLLLRLLSLPLMYMVVLLFVGIGRALTGRWWPGLLGYALSCFAYAATPYHWLSTPFATGTVLSAGWYSPTQAFGTAIFAGLILILVELLRGTAARGPGPWIAVALLAGAVAGAKATFLPLLVCGLALAVVVRLIATRRPGPALGVLGIVAIWLVFAQLGLYGGGDQGLVIKPLFVLKFTPGGSQVLGHPSALNPWSTLVALLVLAVLFWLPPLAGAVGWLRRGVRTDAGYALIAGIGISGAVALFAFGHPGQSEVYFIRSSEPYLALLAACGIAVLVSGLDRRRTAILAAIAGALGVATVYAIQFTVGETRPPAGQLSPVARPFIVLFIVLAVLAVVVALVAVALRLERRAAVVAIVALLTLTAVPTIINIPRVMVSLASSGHLRNVKGFTAITPSGGITATRWLRDHSNPNDLVATNNHCLPSRGTKCDSRDFWIAAYAERRVLVEGWSYTDKATSSLPLYGGLGYARYWNPSLLAANDAVFTNPDTTNVAYLRDQYHVKWLVAVGPHVSGSLAKFATLRYTAGSVSVYELS